MPAPRPDPSQLSLEPGAGPDDDNTTTPTTIRRDRPSLLHQLSIIDAEGWDGPAGRRSIAPTGHVTMMAAVQPFLSGAISKTVNLPESATVEEIEQIYYDGWKLGLKALAVYRDNCKVGQPLSDSKAAPAAQSAHVTVVAAPAAPVRKRLPKSRPSITTSFRIGGAEGYLTAGSYPDDGLGEIFLRLGKQGSTLAGVMDAFSIALQHGVPLETFVQKFTSLRFEPAGMTDDKDVRMAQSIMDYIFRRLALDYLPYETRAGMGIYTTTERTRQLQTGSYEPAEEPDMESMSQTTGAESVPAPETPATRSTSSGVHSSTELLEWQLGRTADAPLCFACGIKMRPSGSCYVCEGCGSTSGCS